MSLVCCTQQFFYLLALSVWFVCLTVQNQQGIKIHFIIKESVGDKINALRNLLESQCCNGKNKYVEMGFEPRIFGKLWWPPKWLQKFKTVRY